MREPGCTYTCKSIGNALRYAAVERAPDCGAVGNDAEGSDREKKLSKTNPPNKAAGAKIRRSHDEELRVEDWLSDI